MRHYARRRALFIALAAGITGLAPGFAEGQNACELMRSNFTRSLEAGGGNRITYISGPLLLGCDDGTRIRADSAQSHSATSFHQLFGNVFFENPEKEMTAERAHYFERESRLVAWGSVVLTDKVNRSVLRGDSLRYLRAGPRRPDDLLTVSGGRARGTLYPDADSSPESGGAPDAGADPTLDPEAAINPEPAAAPPPAAEAMQDTVRLPYEVDADRIDLEGDRLFRAVGTVEIRREGLEAFADTAEYDQVAETFLLFGNARMVGDGYDLAGRRIVLRAPGDELRDIVATGDALLTGEDIVLTSPEIRIYLEDGQMQHLVAVVIPAERPDPVGVAALPALPDIGADIENESAPRVEDARVPEAPRRTGSGRPEATTDDFILLGDSIDVLAPGERLERVLAAGRARGESLAGETRPEEDVPEFARRDWMEGDTIVAFFIPDSAEAEMAGLDRLEVREDPPEAAFTQEPVPAGRSNGYVLERLVARGDARSLYRSEPSDTAGAETPGRLAVHYVVGREITLLMRNGEVDRMEVEGPTDGVHLEPVGRGNGQAAAGTREGSARDSQGGPQ